MDSDRSKSGGHTRNAMIYGVNDTPPWYLCILLAIQQFLTCFSGIFSYPLIISSAICIAGDTVGLGEFINTVIFVCGLSTLLQTTFGVRLPIVQGSSYAFLAPIFVLMSQYQDRCPDFDSPGNQTVMFEKGSEEHKDIWKTNVAEIHGSLMVASVFQMIVGFSGLMTVLIRYIGPLTIAPTISLIGLSLFETASESGEKHWWICFMTIFLVILFSQYLRNVEVPVCGKHKINFFMLFPVLLSIVISWLLCLVLTVTDALPNRPGEWGYRARTDINMDALKTAQWFQFPYPGQWGMPTVTISGVLSMVAACIASMIESVGDYYACARLCRVPPPPASAISRGIGIEGITGLMAGLWGAGGGNTSFSQNIGAIGITKVGSRVVIQCVGLIMIVLGCVGKFGALFVMMPTPIVGGLYFVTFEFGCVGKFGALFVMIPTPIVRGLYFVTFSMVTAVGISGLQQVDLNSTRNMFVFGFAIFFGLCVPRWIVRNPVDVGNDTVNHVLTVLGGTSMLTGGVIAFILDNTIPGTLTERGLLHSNAEDKTHPTADESVYDIPLLRPLLDRIKCIRVLPFCPSSSNTVCSEATYKELGPVDKQIINNNSNNKNNNNNNSNHNHHNNNNGTSGATDCVV